jgi:hypothetical protein
MRSATLPAAVNRMDRAALEQIRERLLGTPYKLLHGARVGDENPKSSAMASHGCGNFLKDRV